jgi:phospholipase C
MRGSSWIAVVALATVFVACAGNGADGTDQAGADLSGLHPPAEWDRAVTRPPSESVGSDQRTSCRFARGAMPAETLGSELPVGSDIPIETIVVLMQENRSFDSYFGHLGTFMHRSDIDGAAESASNPDANGKPHPWQRHSRLCFPDTNHEWDAAHAEYDGGKMDGFFRANDNYHEEDQDDRGLDPSLFAGDRAMWWYDDRDIPFYYELASTFAIGDRYFSSVMGPTYPNRDYLYAATSLGEKDDKFADTSQWSFPEHDLTIFDMLERRGVSWSIFVDGALGTSNVTARVGALLGPGVLTRWAGTKGSRVQSRGAFDSLAQSGHLPQVVFVDASIQEDVSGTDEHPPSNIQNGETWTSGVLHELLEGPQWSRMAIFFTFDENGGIYDHVPPPKACVADSLSADFDRYGFRVPFVVVSPYARKSFVSHAVYDHTSITRFIEAKFRLPALTSRDANALPPYDMFDFQNPPFRSPPHLRRAEDITDPRVATRDVRDQQCQSIFHGNGTSPTSGTSSSPFDVSGN